jgi:hypothetical protein
VHCHWRELTRMETQRDSKREIEREKEEESKRGGRGPN